MAAHKFTFPKLLTSWPYMGIARERLFRMGLTEVSVADCAAPRQR